MSKYSAADFANARFAKHPDGRIAARLQTEEARPWESVRDFHTDEGMAADGWVPVPTKPTITESRLREIRDVYSTHGLTLRGAFAAAGIEVIPDPEPSNAEKLEQLLWAINKEHEGEYLEGEAAVRAWAEALDKAGVTPPNVKGN